MSDGAEIGNPTVQVDQSADAVEIESPARDPVQDQRAVEPPADTPAVEKVVNSDRINLSAAAEYESYLAKTAQMCWAVANFKAPLYEPTSRAPVDIVAVIDKSGSMRGSKIELVKKTLLFVVDQCKFVFSLETGVRAWLKPIALQPHPFI